MRYLCAPILGALLLGGPGKAQVALPPDCGGADVLVVEATAGDVRGFDIIRACALYKDLAENHLRGARLRPHVSFHFVKAPPCASADVLMLMGGGRSKAVCANRHKRGLEIYLSEDSPALYLPLIANALDYANQLYLSRVELSRFCAEVIAEQSDPSLRGRYHPSVSVEELRKH